MITKEPKMSDGLNRITSCKWELRSVLQSLFKKSIFPYRTEDQPNEPQKQINALRHTADKIDTFILELQQLNNATKNYLEKAAKTNNITEKYNYAFNAFETTHKIYKDYIDIK